MNKELSILLVAIGGYGRIYANALLDYKGDRKFKIVGVVDPTPEKYKRFSEIKDKNIPIYGSMEEFYKDNNADLAVISSPIQFHCEQTCFALSHGSHVLCEKPICATAQEARKMMETRDKYGKLVGIGYQWSFSDAIQKLKKDILDGVLGKPKTLKTVVLWPRNYEYYNRNSWAGKKKDARGNWVLDSVANNATAHFLHNMFYVLGDKIDTSEKPVSVTAELYRANKIENFDTAAIRTITENGTQILYYGTHATDKFLGPVFSYEFENATVRFEKGDEDIVAEFKDGTVKKYGDPFKFLDKKLWTMMDAINEGKVIPCGLEAAFSQNLCINGSQDSMPEIVEFPKDTVKEVDDLTKGCKGIYVEGLGDVLKQCYEECVLPSEDGVAWAKSGKKIDMRNYKGLELK